MRTGSRSNVGARKPGAPDLHFRAFVQQSIRVPAYERRTAVLRRVTESRPVCTQQDDKASKEVLSKREDAIAASRFSHYRLGPYFTLRTL